MQWIAPAQKDTDNQVLEKRLWAAADQLRANSGLTSAQYSTPVLGLIFLRFAEERFAKRRAVLEKSASSARRGASRIDDPTAYHAEGVVYLENFKGSGVFSVGDGQCTTASTVRSNAMAKLTCSAVVNGIA
jgi:type I restriction-modification system DNA methylase subunit